MQKSSFSASQQLAVLAKHGGEGGRPSANGHGALCLLGLLDGLPLFAQAKPSVRPQTGVPGVVGRGASACLGFAASGKNEGFIVNFRVFEGV